MDDVRTEFTRQLALALVVQIEAAITKAVGHFVGYEVGKSEAAFIMGMRGAIDRRANGREIFYLDGSAILDIGPLVVDVVGSRIEARRDVRRLYLAKDD